MTGINGSGKTTVVRAIGALTAPSLITLAHMNYEKIEVQIHKDGIRKDFRIWALKNESEFVLETSETDKPLKIQFFSLDSTEPTYRAREKEADYYREIESEYSNHPVMKTLKELPTPMVLGIERRYSEFVLDDSYPINYPLFRSRRRASIDPSNPLGMGLIQAADLAEWTYRRIQAQQNRITEELKKNILLNAFSYEEVIGALAPIKVADLQDRDIENTKKTVQDTFERLSLSSSLSERR